MGLKADQKDYYESELQRRILYIPNLSQFLSKLNDQVLKLPHEINDPKFSGPSGCTEDDIIKSVIRGVEMVYVQVAPARAMLASEEGGMVEFKPKDEEAYKKLDDYNKAMKKLEWIYMLMEEADWLNDRLISESLPGDEDTYDFGGKPNEETAISGTLPPPIEPSDDKTLGPLEEENKQNLAQTDLATRVCPQPKL